MAIASSEVLSLQTNWMNLCFLSRPIHPLTGLRKALRAEAVNEITRLGDGEVGGVMASDIIRGAFDL